MKFVLFDTNAYRNYFLNLDPSGVEAQSKRLRAAHDKFGIVPLMTPVVGLELLVHVEDPSDPARPHALRALAGSIIHCQGLFKPCGDAVIREALFGSLSPEDEKLTSALAFAQAAVAKEFGKSGNDSVYSGDVMASLHSCAEYARMREAAFTAYLEGFIAVFQLGQGDGMASAEERKKRLEELRSEKALRCFAMRANLRACYRGKHQHFELR